MPNHASHIDAAFHLRQYEPVQSPFQVVRWTVSELWDRQSWRMTIPESTTETFETLASGLLDDACDPVAQARQAIPDIARLAAAISVELRSGTGLAWITGLPCEWREDWLRLWYSAIGTTMGQPDETYGLIYEVRDYGSSYLDKPIPVSQTNAETGFHTDSSMAHTVPDLVGLMCLQEALEGGDSLVSNAGLAHHRLQTAKPDLLAILYRDHIRDIVTPGSDRSIMQVMRNRFPVFQADPKRASLLFRYMRYWIEKGHANCGIPLDARNLAALDALDQELSASDAVARFHLKPGDMLWINNRILAHNRSAFRDDPACPRRLLRMWVTLEG